MTPKFTLDDVSRVVVAFTAATNKPPTYLVSSHKVRQRYCDLVNFNIFVTLGGDYPPEYRVTFNGIPWLVDNDCQPDTIHAMPPEYVPADHPPALHPPAV